MLHRSCLVIVLLLSYTELVSALEVQDDVGNRVVLKKPATRIISLAPHVTEMLFAVGAGNKIIGAVDYSDYPEAAKALPRVGGYSRLDVERIVSLKPELIVAWQDGNGKAVIKRLKQLGMSVYVTEPVEVLDVADNLERLALLTGNKGKGSKSATQFRANYARLQQQYSKKTRVSVFYQLWHQPLMTATDNHLIGKVISLCGGQNVFAGLASLTPKVGLESVLAANPQVIIASGMEAARPEWLDDWRRWKQLRAVQNEHLFFIPPDILQRHSPRILEGAQQLCLLLDQVRQSQHD